MNTNLISSAKVLSLPYFPELSAQKTNRVITKHFTNLALYLPTNQLALLNWLIYQSKADNTVVYNTELLTRYSAAVKVALKQYGEEVIYDTLNSGVKVTRHVFKELIESGYLLPNYKKNVFTINPILTYRAEYMRPKDYKEIVFLHKELCRHCSFVAPENREIGLVENFCRRYSEIVEGYMKKKKVV